MLRRTQSTNCLERRQHLLTNSDSIAPVTSLDMLRMYIIYIYERRCAISNLLSNDVVLGNQLYISKCLNFLNCAVVKVGGGRDFRNLRSKVM